jgi:hypothetical protein
MSGGHMTEPRDQEIKSPPQYEQNRDVAGIGRGILFLYFYSLRLKHTDLFWEAYNIFL